MVGQKFYLGQKFDNNYHIDVKLFTQPKNFYNYCLIFMKNGWCNLLKYHPYTKNSLFSEFKNILCSEIPEIELILLNNDKKICSQKIIILPNPNIKRIRIPGEIKKILDNDNCKIFYILNF